MLTRRKNFAVVGIPIILGLLLAAIGVAVACTPPPPARPGPAAPPPCGCGCCPGDGGQGPSANRNPIGGMVIGHTGALYESETDLTVPSIGPQYHMTRTYTNRFDDNPAGNYKGDLGWNWTSRDLMRLAVEEAGTPNPASIRVCYETTFERVFTKTSDSPLTYAGGTAAQDLFDVIEQETIGGTTYWRLTKCCGRKFYFHPFTAGRRSGRLAMEKDAIGNTLSYTYGADDKPASVADTVGNTVYFTYYPAGDGRDGLLKTVQWKYGTAVRQTVYYAYDDQQNLCRATVEVDDVLHTNQTILRTWLYVYAKGTGDAQLDHNLLYVVAPQQYKQMQTDNVVTLQPGTHHVSEENVTNGSLVYDPDGTTFTWSTYAARRYTYFTSRDDTDRVKSEVAANGETVNFTYNQTPTSNDVPQDLVAVVKMIVTVARGVDPVHPEFTEQHAVDALGRLRYESRSDGTVTEGTRHDLDDRGRLEAVTYPDGRKLRSIYQTGYDPGTDGGSETISGTATDYPAYEVVQYVDGGQTRRRVLSHSTYGVTGFPALPLSRVTYKEGDHTGLAGTEGVDLFTTDYCYNSDGTLKYEVQPLVKSGWLPNEASAKDYRLGIEYTYNAAGQVEYEKRFICDSYTPGSPPSFTNKAEQTRTKHEYYTSGASKGLLQYLTVDEGTGKLNLLTEHQYDNWRNPSRTIVDPGSSPHLAIATEYKYDPAGLLLTTTSPGGYYSENSYDLSGRLIQADRYNNTDKDAQIGKSTYTLDIYGRTKVSRQYFGTSDYAESYTTYDNRGRMENQIDPADADGNRHGRKLTYDKWGHVTQTAVGGVWSGTETGSWSTSPDVVSKATIATNYYTEGLTDTTTDGYDDNVGQNQYDPRARLKMLTRKKKSVNYGESGGGTPPTLLQAQYTRDNRGLVTRTVNKDSTGAEINETTAIYDAMARPVSQGVGDGTDAFSTAYEYDQLGRVWQVTSPGGNKTVTQYDAAGRQTQVTDGDGNIAVTVYNAAGQVQKTVRKDHKPGANADPSDYLWYVVSFEYDSEGRTVKVVDQGEDVDRDRTGDGKSGTADTYANHLAAGDYLVTETHYYDADYQTSVVVSDPNSPDRHHTKTIYDGLGRRIWLREGGSGTLGSETYAAETRFDYDKAGRMTALVSGGPDGQVGGDHAADDQTTSYTYTTHGQLDTTTYPDGTPNTVTNTWYAKNDALNTVTDQKGIVVKHEYQAVEPSTGLFHSQSREYVSSGTPDGGDREVVTTADGLGRVLTVVTKATAGGTQTSKLSNTYRFSGALQKQQQQLGDGSGDIRTVEYGFDTCGCRVTRLYWPHTGTAGDYVEYADFDGLDRAKTIKNNIGGTGTDIVKYTFLGSRPASKEYPQSDTTKTVRQTFWSSSVSNYDPFARLLKTHAVRDPGGMPADVVKLDYLYDDASNPTWRYDELQNSGATKWSQKYHYDAQNRLIDAGQGQMDGTWPGTPTITSPDKTWVWNGTVGGTTYTLDKVGNWAKFYNNAVDDTRTHNAANEITARTVDSTSKDPAHDDTGNLTDDGENCKFVYDYRNRLVQAKRRGDNSLKAAYSYDGVDRRIRKIVYDTNGSTELSDTRYLYDGSRMIEERNENDSHKLLARYIFGGLYVDEPVRMYRDGNGDGLFDNAADVNAYFVQDRLFNVVALTDTAGAVLERTWYECYGKPTNRRASDSDETLASHFGNPCLFTGREFDAETGLYYYRARYYDADLGRFVGRDPIGYFGNSHNLYQYVNGRPITSNDPGGMKDACNKEHDHRGNGKPLKWALKASSKAGVPGTGVDEQWSAVEVLHLAEGAQALLEANPAAFTYTIIMSKAMEDAKKNLEKIDAANKANGVSIWVKADYECCEYVSTWPWKKELCWTNPELEGWVRCSASGKSRTPEEGFLPSDTQGIASALGGCFKEAARNLKCP